MEDVVFRNGNQANAARRTPDQPAPTIMFGARSNKVEWITADCAHNPRASGVRVTPEEAALLQSYPTHLPLIGPDLMEDEIALDLFAGTGWGVACKRLGIDERGVEIMEEAVATRTANGMETVYRDVWDGLLLSREMHQLLYGAYTLLIGSPPCQTFSVAGNGAGLAAMQEVLEAIRLHAYKDPQALLEFGEKHDMRTALVLTPLAYVYRDRPRTVVLEQVPTVRPVWEACAEVMREWGYDVKVAVLQAEQYGVPQTRKRAILVARLDGPVALPAPTHSRYYSSSPTKLDPGVLPWVSMAEALGWAADGPERLLCPTNLRPNAAVRATDRPAPTMAFGHERPRWLSPKEREAYDLLGTPAPGVKLTAEEAAALQSYERPFTWCGSQSKVFLQIGNAVPPLLAQRVLEGLTQEQLI